MEIDQDFKKQVYNACLSQMNDRVRNIEVAIEQAENAGADDTKSSAGDKYETTREMMQQEISRNQLQLTEAKKARYHLEQLESTTIEQTIIPGALIQTNQGMFYLTISLGQIHVDGMNVLILSPASPLGQILNGKNKNESFTFNGIEYTINEVY